MAKKAKKKTAKKAKKVSKPKAKKAVKKVKKTVSKQKAKKAVSANPLAGLVGWYTQESQASVRMIGAVPNELLGRKVHPKFRTPGELATHLGDSILGLAETLKTGKLTFGNVSTINTTTEILAHYNKAVEEFKAVAKNVRPANLTKKYPFEMNGKVMWNPTGIEMAQAWVCHEIHHRAQIGTLLRILDARVPGMYGPTADDM
ncbi:hypothetical protein F9K33_09725 [bacterium]|nr:MAG: hypothetical protein F9K33_09725 [bacterium]